jgi:hypothetical protein
MSVAGALINAEVGFTATVMIGRGGPIFAPARSSCTGKFTDAPRSARSALAGTVKAPALVALPKATTLTAMVQLTPKIDGGSAGVFSAVRVIADAALVLTVVGQVFIVGLVSTSRKFSSGSGTFVAKLVSENDALMCVMVNVSVEVSPSAMKSGVNAAFTVVCACACGAAKNSTSAVATVDVQATNIRPGVCDRMFEFIRALFLTMISGSQIYCLNHRTIANGPVMPQYKTPALAGIFSYLWLKRQY